MVKLLTLSLLLLLISDIISQTTTIPDPNFEQRLIVLGYDTGTVNGFVPTSYIDTITKLDNITNSGISDLTGIEDFTALKNINCSNNLLTSLDFSQNTALDSLYCANNLLTSINVTQNTNLRFLRFQNNLLNSIDLTQNPNLLFLLCNKNLFSSIDVSQNVALKTLYINQNQMTSIDVSQNLALDFLDVQFNQITEIDVSANSSLTGIFCNNNQLICLNIKNGNNAAMISNFNAQSNPNLNCIEVDNPTWSTTWWTQKVDAGCTFSTNCNNSCSPIGINEYDIKEINIYPSPTSHQLTIDYGQLKIEKINLIDITGKTIKTIKQNTNTINVADLSNGIYFIKLITDERTITKKFIKQ